MKTAYFDCSSGASGDMILASLIDAGLDITVLYERLKSLKLDGFNISTHKTKRSGIAALRFDVEITGEHPPHRDFSDIVELINVSDLDASVKNMSQEIFRSLAEAEGKVHGCAPEDVHFHEVGAIDSIVDIIGAVCGFAEMGVEDVIYGPFSLGSGTVECSHGKIPLPSPATLELVRGFRVRQTAVDGELLTPTGAAILTTIGTQTEASPEMILDKVGCGAGSGSREGIPNVLRVMIGNVGEIPTGGGVLVLETEIDDMSPEFYPAALEKLFEAGALDVYLTPILMKKGRPGNLLTVIVEENRRVRVEEMIFKHTSTFGLRRYVVQRSCLDRVEDLVETRYGSVRVKKGFYRGELLRTVPEYEDCKRIADEADISVGEVWNEALPRE